MPTLPFDIAQKTVLVLRAAALHQKPVVDTVLNAARGYRKACVVDEVRLPPGDNFALDRIPDLVFPPRFRKVLAFRHEGQDILVSVLVSAKASQWRSRIFFREGFV